MQMIDEKHNKQVLKNAGLFWHVIAWTMIEKMFAVFDLKMMHP